jgi:hypothetical protein
MIEAGRTAVGLAGSFNPEEPVTSTVNHVVVGFGPTDLHRDYGKNLNGYISAAPTVRVSAATQSLGLTPVPWPHGEIEHRAWNRWSCCCCVNWALDAVLVPGKTQRMAAVAAENDPDPG